MAGAALSVALVAARPDSSANADSRAFLPVVVQEGVPPRAGPLPQPDVDLESDVWRYLPVPPTADLSFFDAAADTVAWYRLDDTPGAVLSWYGERMPRWGWTLRSASAARQVWAGHGARLTLTVETDDAAPRLVVESRDRVAAHAPASLERAWPLPTGAERRRYDPQDIIAEEVWSPHTPAEAMAIMSATLGADGWAMNASRAYGSMRMQRFARGADRAVVAAWVQGEGTALGVGGAACLPAEDLPATRSVYLEAAVGPPGGTLIAYTWPRPDALAVERWRAACLDLDVYRQLQATSAATSGWRTTPGKRLPGVAVLSAAPPDGLPQVAFSATVDQGGVLGVALERDPAGRAVPEGHSLLFDDVPLPSGDAVAMTVDAAGWRHREGYRLTILDATAAREWLSLRLPPVGWLLERREPPGDGDGLVFARDGEELLADVRPGPQAEVWLHRRRVCADGVARIAPGPAGTPRWLLEVPVVPGALYDGFDEPVERYRLDCAGLEVLVDWYREVMAAGNWALAGTELPTALRREMLFVRPDELSLPHHQRSAWARVAVQRAWPYRFQLELSRDPRGVKP